MYIELNGEGPTRCRLFSFVNSQGEVEITVQAIDGAPFQWQGTMTGGEALQLAQQVEETARVALDGKCPTCGRAGMNEDGLADDEPPPPKRQLSGDEQVRRDFP